MKPILPSEWISPKLIRFQPVSKLVKTAYANHDNRAFDPDTTRAFIARAAGDLLPKTPLNSDARKKWGGARLSPAPA
jgi:hypothetical protein